MRKTKIILLFITLSFIVTSCSSEEDSNSSEQKGRFDNKPFKWDEVPLRRNVNDTYIGDSFFESRDAQVSAPTGIYVGEVFEYLSAKTLTFDRENTSPRNPIDLIFDFQDPYIENVTKETGSLGYQLAFKKALNSSEYSSHIKKQNKAVNYFMTEYFSYSDITKSMKSNAGILSAFASKIQDNSRNIKIKSRLLTRIIIPNFTVYMDYPSGGIFKNKETPNSSNNGEDFYIRSMTYGKVAYVAIESEYSYPEVKKALESSLSFNFGGRNTNMSNETIKIFSKSSVTAFSLYNNSTESYFMNGITNIQKFLEKLITETTYGSPIYIQMRGVKSNSSILPKGY